MHGRDDVQYVGLIHTDFVRFTLTGAKPVSAKEARRTAISQIRVLDRVRMAEMKNRHDEPNRPDQGGEDQQRGLSPRAMRIVSVRVRHPRYAVGDAGRSAPMTWWAIGAIVVALLALYYRKDYRDDRRAEEAYRRRSVERAAANRRASNERWIAQALSYFPVLKPISEGVFQLTDSAYEHHPQVLTSVEYGVIVRQADESYIVNYDATGPDTLATPSLPDHVYYSQYFSSPAWCQRRDEAQRRAGNRCQVCNSPDRLEVHHRT
jgi:hypothetical protein